MTPHRLDNPPPSSVERALSTELRARFFSSNRNRTAIIVGVTTLLSLFFALAVVVRLSTSNSSVSSTPVPPTRGSGSSDILTLETSSKPSWIMLAGDALLWSSDDQGGRVAQHNIQQNTTSVVAKSLFDRGLLVPLDVSQSSDWLFVQDMPQADDMSTWQVRGINLATKAGVTLVTEERSEYAAPGPGVGVGDRAVVWTISTNDQKRHCVLSTLMRFDLGTQDNVMVDSVCEEHNFRWTVVRASGDMAVLERDWSDERGGGSDIYTLDIQTGHLTQVTTDHKSSMPDIWFPWIAWKQAKRYEAGRMDILYNVLTGERLNVDAPGIFPSDPKLSEYYLYWEMPAPGEPAMAYNILARKLVQIVVPQSSEAILHVSAYGHRFVWFRDPSWDSAIPHQGTLETTSVSH